MQGIRVAELKILLDYLKTLKDLESLNLPEEKLQLITEKEEELRKIYSNYRLTLQQVSEYIERFEHEKQVIRRFIKESKILLKNNKRMELNQISQIKE